MDRIQQLDDTGLFEAMVPRYTSYPTAPHFHDTPGLGGLDSWTRDLGEGAEVSLYVHIPFCERLCWFCACRTQGVRSAAPVQSYLETLKTEIAHIGAAMPISARVTRLHWGGGTPTILTPAQITDLNAALRAAFPFSPDTEFSVEIDPTLVDVDKIDALAAAGMARASIGIQDFDPGIQKAIGREQTFERTRDVVRQLRAAGIVSLNTDIVYGLPDQTLEGIGRSTEKVLALDPDRVALFGYAHVPWVAKRQRMIDAEALPSPRARLALLEQTEAQFADAGYCPLGIDHFAKPGDSLAEAARRGALKRNFQGYTDDPADALIGLGASAVSRFPGGYLQNAARTSTWAGRIQAGGNATARGHRFTLEDRVRAMLIERLLCDMEVDTRQLKTAFGTFAEVVQTEIRRVVSRYAGWVVPTDHGFSLTQAAKPLARLIASEFDAYLPGGPARHSSAI